MPELKPIRWTLDMFTGVADIDRQHRVLVNTLNQVIEHLPDRGAPGLAKRITHDLVDYALYHFEMEEGLMEACGYHADFAFDARSHLAQHRAFAERAAGLRDRVEAGDPLDLEGLLRFLHGWLINHIMNSDVRLGRFILERRTAEEASSEGQA